ncbi:MAG: AAA family ATPase [Steroidobacteraceae bacterium]|nr:AAA family ATPase [Steroidobacteraceae bacterium]
MDWRAALLDPAAYPGPPSRVELRETHASWIALAGEFAWKLKRPVRFPFLDYSTPERRLAACETELRVNSRWAPQLYLDLQAAVPRGDGIRFVAAGAASPGTALEYAVRLRRFAASDELPALLERGAVAPDELAAFGTALAAWQAAGPAPPDGSDYGHATEALRAALDNFASLASRDARDAGADAAADADAADADGRAMRRLRDWTVERHAELAPLLESRRDAGRVRECHGDLHAANVVRIDGRLVPFDGIDFDPRLAYVDVANDAAFLAMDLEQRGHPGLAHAFLSAWLEASGDAGAPRVLPWFIAYRALVRAKVEDLRIRELKSRLGTRSPTAAEARALRAELVATAAARRRHVAVAAARLDGRSAALYVTVGLSGSGKSWLAERLVATLPALRARSDVERKRLAGLAPTAASGSSPRAGLYSADWTARTYARLREIAVAWLAARYDVIVDATALDPRQRAGFAAAARQAGARLAWLHCTAPTEVLRARVASRRGDASEATLEVLEIQLQHGPALDAAELARTVTVDTSRPIDVAAVAAALRSAAAPPAAS